MTPDDVKRKALEAADAVGRFNRKPPVWFYWVLGAVIILAAQSLRFL
jgi:hypothetical protein